MRSLRLSSVALTIVSVGLVAFFIYFFYINRDDYIKLLNISAPSLITLLLISMAYPILNGAINVYMLQCLGTHISLYNGSILAAASSLANLLPVTGGLISKSVYLKVRYHIPYTRFVGAILASFVCFVAANGIIGLSILIYWMITGNKTISPLLLIIFFLMAVCLLAFWFPFNILKIPSTIGKRLEQILEGWKLISKTPFIILKIIALQTGLMLLLALRYWIAFRMISQNVSISQCILFATVSILEQFIGIAPGGIGIREALVAAIAAALQIDIGISIIAVELDRLVSTFVIILLGLVSTTLLGRQLATMPNEIEKLV